MLTLTPVVCMLSGIAFSGLLDLFFKEDAIQRPEETEAEESSAVSGKLYDKVTISFCILTNIICNIYFLNNLELFRSVKCLMA